MRRVPLVVLWCFACAPTASAPQSAKPAKAVLQFYYVTEVCRPGGDAARLARDIRDTVGPGSWGAIEGACIKAVELDRYRTLEGTLVESELRFLVVRTTPAIHERVRRYLDDARRGATR